MSLRVAAVDLNGQFRGKRIPDGASGKRMHLPLSILNVDIEGSDVEGSPLVFATGDQDGIMAPWSRGSVPLPWLGQNARLQPCMLLRADGTPFEGDPRQALKAVLDRFAAKGMQVIAASELEFYLLEENGNLAPAVNPTTGRRMTGTQTLSLRALDGFSAFFDAVETAGQAMGLEGLTITSEGGVGQFEVTLGHTDALKAADDVVLLKEMIKGTARQHKMTATFMAKPFADEPGNGLHTHFSILDGTGENIFTHDAQLHAAIAGCMDHFTASTLIFAPHSNSYARFVADAHAPTSASWGEDNRTVALRIPASSPSNRRLEHRVAGGDVNPYLVYAAVFGAALDGLDQNAVPPAMTTGNAYDQTGAALLHPTWQTAISGFSDASWTGIFPPLLVENYLGTKRQEAQLFAGYSDTQALWRLLETV
ncbi:MAG: glutamine synthetase family protein [Planktomarina sp.]